MIGLDFIVAKVGGQAAAYAGAGIAGIVVAWGLKKIPNNVLKAKFNNGISEFVRGLRSDNA